MANAAYIRVSSADQDGVQQSAALDPYQIDQWFVEKSTQDSDSGSAMDRPELQHMLSWAGEGDTVYVDDFSRLACSMRDLQTIAETLQKKKARLVSVEESLDTATPMGQLFMIFVETFNKFERQADMEEQGKKGPGSKNPCSGRHRKVVKNFEEYYRLYQKREIESKAELARRLKISRPTLYRLIREREQKI